MRSIQHYLLFLLAFILITPAIAAEQFPKPSDGKIHEGTFVQFKPTPSNDLIIDHSYWNAFLGKTVLDTGPSTRIYYNPRIATTGTNIRTGHSSRYAMEGNKINFYDFEKEHIEAVRIYHKSLTEFANTYDVTVFPKSEQLAFWLNLHNSLAIGLIAEAYPIRQPSRIFLKEHDEYLQNAKIITIKGVPLSLTDIREKIVYKNWEDPVVFYGFFRGEIGSPSINPQAFTGNNVKYLLADNAKEFVNALRGYDKGNVSKLYEEIAPYYFKNYRSDMKSHLSNYMRDDVSEELDEFGIIGFSKYSYDICDLSRGTSTGSHLNVQIMNGLEGVRLDTSGAVTGIQGTGVQRGLSIGTDHNFVEELNKKFEKLEEMGLLGSQGVVTIEDVPTKGNVDE